MRRGREVENWKEKGENGGEGRNVGVRGGKKGMGEGIVIGGGEIRGGRRRRVEGLSDEKSIIVMQQRRMTPTADLIPSQSGAAAMQQPYHDLTHLPLQRVQYCTHKEVETQIKHKKQSRKKTHCRAFLARSLNSVGMS